MKQNTKSSFNVAYCGIMCALSILVMFTAIIPSLTYVMPAVAGVIIWSVSIQVNRAWGFLTYAAAAILSLFLVPEVESRTFFILIFGYYPLLKEIIHSRISGGIWAQMYRFLVKLAIFNTAAVLAYTAVVYVFGIKDVLDGLDRFGEYAIYVFWGMGNVAFLFYDFALKHVFYAFRHWIKPVIDKKIK